jgi:hypothetical protein
MMIGPRPQKKKKKKMAPPVVELTNEEDIENYWWANKISSLNFLNIIVWDSFPYKCKTIFQDKISSLIKI